VGEKRTSESSALVLRFDAVKIRTILKVGSDVVAEVLF
jgi:hypothetical protein